MDFYPADAFYGVYLLIRENSGGFMQINAIYKRSMIQTMAGKAIRDLRGGGERELRNVMELCKRYAVSYGYQQLWNRIEEVLHHPNQRYGALLSRAANHVDVNCLKTLIANLGMHAYAYGSGMLQDDRGTGASSVYWMEPLDGTMEPDSLQQTISDMQRQGASSFLFREGQETELETVLNLAGNHRQCVFFLICQSASSCLTHLEDMIALGNVIPLVEYKELPVLSNPLKQAGILFGFYRGYEEIQSLEAEEKLLCQLIERGCFLGVYEGSGQAADDKPELFYYAKLQEIRSEGTKEILLIDLWRDRETVQKWLLHQQASPDRSPKRKTDKNI